MKEERTLNLALKIPYVAIFRLELEKAIFMLTFSTFNLSKCKKKINCRTKIVLIRCFWAGTRKSYHTVVFLHQHHQMFSNKILSKN